MARGPITCSTGEVANSYAEYLGTYHWLAIRKLAIDRSGGVCEHCSCTPRSLDVHHVTYERVGHEDLGDLLALCRECHTGEHNGIDSASYVVDEICRSWGSPGLMPHIVCVYKLRSGVVVAVDSARLAVEATRWFEHMELSEIFPGRRWIGYLGFVVGGRP